MASDLPSFDTGLVGFVSAALGALGAFGLWLANRMLGKAAFQTAINSGFKELTDQLQQERAELLRQIHDERIKAAAEHDQLRGEIVNLTRTVESLKALLRANGIAVPDRHRHSADVINLDARND